MLFSRKVHKGVILAAGDGDRLGSLTLTYPKVLLPVKDKPLISYPIEALVAAGVSEIAIVLGYLGDKVIEVLGNGSNFGVRLHYIFNPDYLGGNAISVYKVRDWTQGDPIALCMGDHLIDKDLVSHLVEGVATSETLCVDYNPGRYLDINEATKVTLDGYGSIIDIGKGLAHWDALDTGVFLLTSRFFQVLNKLVRRQGVDLEMCDVIRFLIGQGYRIGTCDVSGYFWTDVDTKEDLNTTRRMVGGL